MGKMKDSKERAVVKSITILPEQQSFIDEEALNLSRFVQKKLEEEIKKKKKG